MNQISSSHIFIIFSVFLVTITVMDIDHVNAQESSIPYIIQNTVNSTQDPLPGHESHQVAIVAPPMKDGKIYSGIISFTSSQPVEVIILHKYEKNFNFANYGKPLSASFGNGNYAASVIKQFTDPTFNAGSFAFAGNALAFHNLEGKQFSVTFTLKGEISSLTN